MIYNTFNAPIVTKCFIVAMTSQRSNEMTREEALKLLGGVLQGYLLKDDINQIYNDHEAQIKAKDEEIERLEKYISNLEDGLRLLREARKLQGE